MDNKMRKFVIIITYVIGAGMGFYAASLLF